MWIIVNTYFNKLQIMVHFSLLQVYWLMGWGGEVMVVVRDVVLDWIPTKMLAAARTKGKMYTSYIFLKEIYALFKRRSFSSTPYHIVLHMPLSRRDHQKTVRNVEIKTTHEQRWFRIKCNSLWQSWWNVDCNNVLVLTLKLDIRKVILISKFIVHCFSTIRYAGSW